VNRLKFAVLAPPEIPIPLGDSYGGVELIAQGFAYALAEAGHDVALYCTPALRDPRPDLKAAVVEGLVPTLMAYPSSGPIRERYDYTFDFTHQKPLSKDYDRSNYAATTFLTDRPSHVNDVYPTRAVQAGFPMAPGVVIHPGIRDVYDYRSEKGGYLLFLGRIAPYKRPDIALQVARLSGMHAVVAGHVGAFSSWPDPDYASAVRALCEKDGAEFVANPTLERKRDLLAGAAAVVVPSDWSVIGSQESFGIVAVEALLSGSPVITSGDGGLREIVTPECGFVCRSLADYLAAVNAAGKVDRAACRERGLYFTAERMAQRYMGLVEGKV
jgi:glycosyltransferase involved in cell wall biosynthesis